MASDERSTRESGAGGKSDRSSYTELVDWQVSNGLLAAAFLAFVGSLAVLAWQGSATGPEMLLLFFAACAYVALIVASERYRESHGRRSDPWRPGQGYTRAQRMIMAPPLVLAVLMLAPVLALLVDVGQEMIDWPADGVYAVSSFVLLTMFYGVRSARRNVQVALAACNTVLVASLLALFLLEVVEDSEMMLSVTLVSLHVLMCSVLVQRIRSSAPLEEPG